MTALRIAHVSLLLGSLVACGGQALDVGSNDGGSGGSGASSAGSTASGAMATGGAAGQPSGPDTSGVGAQGNVTMPPDPLCESDPPPGEPLPAWPALADCAEGTSLLQGTWSGYVQGGSGTFPNEGDFTVALAGDDDALCGTITWGSPVELAPATDPTVSYPPDQDLSKFIPLLDGYTYQLAEPTVSGKRVKFSILLAEPMRSWCQLQTPYFDSTNGTGWGCTRNVGTSYTYEPTQQCHQTDPCTHEALIVSCDQTEICGSLSQPCSCNAEGCDANVEATQHYFDLRFDGDEATGEVDGQIVYLTRE